MSNYINIFKNSSSFLGLPEESRQKLLDDGKKISELCVEDLGGNKCEPNQKVNLLLGKIQSGKTKTFLCAAAYCLDLCFDVVVVLGGTDQILFDQNKGELEAGFKRKMRDFFITNDKYPTILSTGGEDLKHSFEKEIEIGQKVIVCSMKQKNHLKKLKEVFKIAKQRKLNVLFIDDEADYYTLNSNATNEQKEESKLYSELKMFVKNKEFKNSTISVTATPYANIFMEKEDNLYPDNCFLVYPNSKYKGINFFHKENYEKNIIIVPNSKLNKSIDLINDDGFKKAISSFILGAMLLNTKDKEKDNNLINYSMLVNVDKKIINNSKIRDQLNQYLMDLKLKKDSITKNTGEELWRFINFGLQTHGMPTLGFKNGEINDDQKELVDNFCKALDFTKAFIVSGDKEYLTDREEFKNNTEHFAIWIGCDLLQRGVVIKNLLTTYFVNRAKKPNADTQMQRARWCGYRTETALKYTKIFLTEEINTDFINTMHFENEIWQIIEDCNESGSQFKGVDLVIKDHFNSSMFPTAKGKASFERVSGMAWYSENCYKPIELIDSDQENQIKKLFTKTSEITFPSGKKLDYFSADSKYIFNHLSDFPIKYILDSINPGLFAYWKKNYLNDNTEIAFVKMNDLSSLEEGSFRTINTKTETFEIHGSGSTEENYLNKNAYSERRINRHEVLKDKIVIQVYKFDIRLRKEPNSKEYFIKNKNTLFFAVKFPDNDMGSLTSIKH